MIEIETERLNIRLIEAEDWQAIRTIWEDFKRSEYVFYDNEKDTRTESLRPRIEKWAQFSQTGKEHVFFAICLDGEVIGYTSLNARADCYEIGYGFRENSHGKGYAYEGISAILSYAHEMGITKFSAGTAIRNVPSVRLLKRLGFELVGTETLSFFTDSEGKAIEFEGGIFEKIYGV